MPSPPSSDAQPSISAEINAATRKQHAELNRLITEHLPLALPPNATTPGLLVQGLEPFALIFNAFENRWSALEKSVAEKSETANSHDAAVLAWLGSLRPKGLQRTPRLRKDLQYMADVAGGSVLTTGPLLQPDLDMRTLHEKPHVLIAYGWVFYMAIFSGGRWMRRQMANAGPKFWDAELDQTLSEKDRQQLAGFSFLSFKGDQDGEDIKEEFKTKLAEAETLLSPQERRELVEQAQKLFELCICMVKDVEWAIWRRKAERTMRTVAIVVLVLLAVAWLSGAFA